MNESTALGPARTREALHAILEDAFNRGDLDAYTDAFERDATLVVPPEGHVVCGHADIRSDGLNKRLEFVDATALASGVVLLAYRAEASSRPTI